MRHPHLLRSCLCCGNYFRRDYFAVRVSFVQTKSKLECGPMPNMMAALRKLWRKLGAFTTPQFG